MKCDVFEACGKSCVTVDDGSIVYDNIYPKLKNEERVELDFDGVEVFASPFFNVAIGQLLKDFTPDELNTLLAFTHLIPAGMTVLKRVIDNAKEYYSYDNKARSIMDEILNTHNGND